LFDCASLTAQPVLFINSALPTSHLAWGTSGKDVRFLNRLRRLLGKTDEVGRKLNVVDDPENG
jgi:hypothetical protein